MCTYVCRLYCVIWYIKPRESAIEKCFSHKLLLRADIIYMRIIHCMAILVRGISTLCLPLSLSLPLSHALSIVLLALIHFTLSLSSSHSVSLSLIFAILPLDVKPFTGFRRLQIINVHFWLEDVPLALCVCMYMCVCVFGIAFLFG